jgi:hypothetical protein
LREPVRKIDLFTRINVLVGSTFSKVIMLVPIMTILLPLNILQSDIPRDATIVSSAVYLIINYLLVIKPYLKVVKLFKGGQITKGKLHKKEETRVYNQSPFRYHPYWKYHFKFNDQRGQEFKYIKWTTANKDFKGKRQPIIVYNPNHPDTAIEVNLIHGGPYQICEERVTSSKRSINILTMAVAIICILLVMMLVASLK